MKKGEVSVAAFYDSVERTTSDSFVAFSKEFSQEPEEVAVKRSFSARNLCQAMLALRLLPPGGQLLGITSFLSAFATVFLPWSCASGYVRSRKENLAFVSVAILTNYYIRQGRSVGKIVSDFFKCSVGRSCE